jgi:hypothetical protein
MIFIGDLHGDLEAFEKILITFPREEIVLLGDILDSFVFSVEQQIRLLQRVLEEISKGKVECLLGNHEYSYLLPNERCSGFNPATAAHMIHLQNDIWKYFDPFIWLDYDEKKILITHAGLTKPLWESASDPILDDIPNILDSWIKDIRTGSSPWLQCGKIRGGFSAVGGPIWCQYPNEFEEIPGLIQVFGHTRQEFLNLKEPTFCLCQEDGKMDTVLQFDDKKFSGIRI